MSAVAPRRPRGLFLDRDGTVSPEIGYLVDPSRLELLPGAAEAIRLARGNGFRIAIVTNQSGVARGLFDEAAIECAHRRMHELLARDGARVDSVQWCPHHPDADDARYRRVCDCRKPQPGMLQRAAAELGVPLADSFMIGDRRSDLEAGVRAGARTIGVRTGVGDREFGYHSGSGAGVSAPVADDLLQAVQWIVAGEPPGGPGT